MLRAALVWLVAIANPAQAFAAATTQACGPGHERMHRALTASSGHLPPDPAHTDAGATRAGTHLHAPAHAQVGGVDRTVRASTAGTFDQRSFDEPGAHGCSACAACCVALALPVDASLLVGPAARFGAAASPRSPSPRFLTPGPERPPRALPA